MSKVRWMETLPSEGRGWTWLASALVMVLVLVAAEGWARQTQYTSAQTTARVMGVVRLERPGSAGPSESRRPTKGAQRKENQTQPRKEKTDPSLSSVETTVQTTVQPTAQHKGIGSKVRKTKETLSSSPESLASSSTSAQAVVASARQVSPQQLDAGFRQIAGAPPRYPRQARRAGVAGEVQLELQIATTGMVERVHISDEPVGWGFGEEVRRAYLAARFSPPTVAGQPVRVRWIKTLRFQP